MTEALTQCQLRFLDVLSCKPSPNYFGWYQPARATSAVRGALVAAYGHPDTWTHFVASTATGERACIPKDELAALHDDGLVAHLQITDAGRKALAQPRGTE